MFQLIQVWGTVLKLEDERGLFVTGWHLNIAGLKISQIGTTIDEKINIELMLILIASPATNVCIIDWDEIIFKSLKDHEIISTFNPWLNWPIDHNICKFGINWELIVRIGEIIPETKTKKYVISSNVILNLCIIGNFSIFCSLPSIHLRLCIKWSLIFRGGCSSNIPPAQRFWTIFVIDFISKNFICKGWSKVPANGIFNIRSHQ